MRIVRDLEELTPPEGGTSVTIGTFDGVHLGHRALIDRTLAAATAWGSVPMVVTWDRHPAVTLRPDETPALLTSTARKIELLSSTDVELLIVIPFDEAFSHLSPLDFVADILVKRSGARSVHVGHDWRFGHKAAGDVPLLTELGAAHGFEVEGIDLTEIDREPVTSSRTRRALAAGDVELASRLLGRVHDVDGKVVTGEKRGRSLGFPTANIEVPPALATPGIGIYAGVVRVAATGHAAAISVGTNPTFGAGREVRLEAYLLDFDRSIYGEDVRVEFHHRLREERAFSSTEALVAQIEADVAATRAAVGDIG